jgi:hypothetical protein
MTLLDTPRFHWLALCGALISAALLATFHAHQMTTLPPAFAADDSRAALRAAGQPVMLSANSGAEGCSSCPPADALLARLLQQQPVAGADIIVLEEHVDYWEGLGWHDRFASRQFTDRQSGYAHALHLNDNYTPQMVVDGVEQFVGNDSSHALHAIAQAARTPKLALTLTIPLLDGNRINAAVAAPPAAALPKADLYAVLVEAMASTNVLGGENGGRTLHHVSVVRSMQRIGSLSPLSHDPVSVHFDLPAKANPANLRMVVFAQLPGQGAVLGAAQSAVRSQLPPGGSVPELRGTTL